MATCSRYIFCSHCSCRTLRGFAEQTSTDGRLRCAGCGRIFGERIPMAAAPPGTLRLAVDRKALQAGEAP